MNKSVAMNFPFLELMPADNRADYLAEQRKWRKMLAKARRALTRLTGPELASAAVAYLAKLSSEERAATLVWLLKGKPPEVFWKVFLHAWPNCDATWTSREQLLTLLQNASAQISAVPFLDNRSRAFFESLTNDITIFRGCSRERIKGLSWTTDAAVARKFALGHRFRVRDPVLVTARIKKQEILAIITVRDESEIVCDPSEVLRIDDI